MQAFLKVETIVFLDAVEMQVILSFVQEMVAAFIIEEEFSKKTFFNIDHLILHPQATLLSLPDVGDYFPRLVAQPRPQRRLIAKTFLLHPFQLYINSWRLC